MSGQVWSKIMNSQVKMKTVFAGSQMKLKVRSPTQNAV